MTVGRAYRVAGASTAASPACVKTMFGVPQAAQPQCNETQNSTHRALAQVNLKADVATHTKRVDDGSTRVASTPQLQLLPVACHFVPSLSRPRRGLKEQLKQGGKKSHRNVLA